MSSHVVPVRVYIAIFLCLMVLTAITVFAAFKDLGPLNTFVALGIAITKATLVILYFMHLRYSERLLWLVVASSFFWLLILFVITMADYLSRSWMNIYTP